MKIKVFYASAVSASVLKLIVHEANPVVHLLLQKCSMAPIIEKFEYFIRSTAGLLNHLWGLIEMVLGILALLPTYNSTYIVSAQTEPMCHFL